MHGFKGLNKALTIIIGIIFVLIITTTAVVGTVISRAEAFADKQKRDKAAPLEAELSVLERELYGLEERMIESLPNGSALTIAITHLGEELYDVVYPIFCGTGPYNTKEQDVRLTGVMCLSDTELPGEEGRITLLEYNEMISAGWSTAITVDNHAVEDMRSYFDGLIDKFIELEITFPHTVYFTEWIYDSSLDSVLNDYGITSVIHHGEEDRPLICEDYESDMWRPGAMGWNNIGKANPMFTQLVSNSGAAAFTITFDPVEPYAYFDVEYDEAHRSLSRMLDKFREYVYNGDLAVGSPTRGRDVYEAYIKSYKQAIPELDKRREELKAEISVLKAAICRIYNGE